jgi:hypothetical protein
MRHLLLICLALLAALPAGAAADPPPTGCAAVEPLAVRFQGAIESAGPARWQVAGQWLQITPATVVMPPGTIPVTGDWAQVAALWRLDGSLAATSIEIAPSPPASSQLTQFTGLIEAIGLLEWVVSGVPVAVTPDTVIVGQAEVGSVALVQARRPAARLVAELLAAAPPGVDPIFLTGALLAMQGDVWLVQAAAGVAAVQVGGETFVQGQPVVGRTVQIMALERPGQPAQAVFAAVLPPEAQPVYFGGRLAALIDATAPEQWLLLAASDDGPWLELRTLVVDRPSTPIDETAGPVIPGAWLDVSALAPLLPGQPWTARSLRVALGPQASVQGAISQVLDGAPARWQAGDVCIIVGQDATVDGRPRPDRHAIVQGTRLGPAAVWARSAAVRYRFEGILVARLTHVTPPLWVVAVTPPGHVDASAPTRVYLVIDATSRIDPALQPGMLGIEVVVQARAGPGGWLADWVDDPAAPWQP